MPPTEYDGSPQTGQIGFVVRGLRFGGIGFVWMYISFLSMACPLYSNQISAYEPRKVGKMATETKKRSSKRRGNGEGSIYQRGTGRWEATITVGYNAHGKRVRRTVYGWSKKEVQDKLTGLQSKKLDGSLAETSKITVADFLARWLDTVAKPAIRATTYSNYESAIRLHIGPFVGGLALAKFTPADAQGLYAELEKLGRFCHIRRVVHAVLHRALKQAVRWRWCPVTCAIA